MRVAAHPDVQGMGYGTRAMKLLMEHYSCPPLVSLDDNEGEQIPEGNDVKSKETDKEVESVMKPAGTGSNSKAPRSALLNEIIGPRKALPPLLRHLQELVHENLDYLGVSYGLTQGLFNFWSRLGFVPLYIRLTPNELTGEHTCIMVTTKVSPEDKNNAKWLADFHMDFRRRFVHLLSYDFRKLSPGLALAILDPNTPLSGQGQDKSSYLSLQKIKEIFSPYDLRRLESYSKNLVDYHVVVDMLPKLAELHTLRGFGSEEELRLSPAQNAILMALGLQHKSVEEIQKCLNLQSTQVLALFNKTVRKTSTYIRRLEEKSIAGKVGPEDVESAAKAALPRASLSKSLDEDLEDGTPVESEEVLRNSGLQVKNDIVKEGDRRRTKALSKYERVGDEKEWQVALDSKDKRQSTGAPLNLVSIKTVKRKPVRDFAFRSSDATNTPVVSSSKRSRFAKGAR